MQTIRSFFFLGILFLLACGQQRRPDKEIEADVAVKLHDNAPNITISVRDGVVYLSGLVKDSASWRATLSDARSVPGVRSLDDKLHIGSALRK